MAIEGLLVAASDQSPMLINLLKAIPCRSRTVKSEASWMHDHSCDSVVARAWDMSVEGSFKFSVLKKNDNVMKSLLRWNSEEFGNISKKLKKSTCSLLKSK